MNRMKKTLRNLLILCAGAFTAISGPVQAADIIHDAEYYILEAQNGEQVGCRR